MLVPFKADTSHHVHVQKHLGLFDSLEVSRPTSDHHIYNDHLPSSLSCWYRSLALSKDLDAGVVIKGIQNSLRYVEMPLKLMFHEGKVTSVMFKRKGNANVVPSGEQHQQVE